MNPLREFCPSCGASIHSRFGGPRRSGPAERPPEELKHNRKTVLAIAAGVLILGAAAGRFHPFGLSSFPRHVTIHTHNEPRGPVTIGAAQLFEAYHSDSDAADRQYGGREMVVTGEFVRTVPDGYGSIDMRLKTAHPDKLLGIDIDNHSVDAATRLVPGQVVTVDCRKVAGSGDDPWLQDCVIQPPAPAAAAQPPPPPSPPSPQPPAPR